MMNLFFVVLAASKQFSANPKDSWAEFLNLHKLVENIRKKQQGIYKRLNCNFYQILIVSYHRRNSI